MTLSREEARVFGNATGATLDALCARAAALRDANWGRDVSYSRKVFIPLTNMCRNRCGYCSFVKGSGHPEARFLAPDEVLAIARSGQQAGCKEALFSLGERPERRHSEVRAALKHFGYASTLDYLRAMARRVLEESSLLPHLNAGALSGAEMAILKPVSASMGMMLETTSRRLMAAGQAHHGCPDKLPSRRMATLIAAGQEAIPFTTGILIGIGETWAERVDALLALAEVHRGHAHIQEVIVQNFRARPGTAMAAAPEPDAHDMRRTLAVARLILPPEVSLQAPPNLAERYEVWLDAGINDWGGISPVTEDHINPEWAWPTVAELAARCAAAGHRLVERLTVYPRFVAQPERFLAPGVRASLARLADGAGMAREPCLV